MLEDKFENLEELYHRLIPALTSKKEEMERLKMVGMKEKDLWLYFCKNTWKGKSSLTLGEMVSDILNTDNFLLYSNWKGVGYGTNSSEHTK